MTRRGWAGAPPADDDEARTRIIEATIRSVELRGAAATTLSDVAADLGVIRKTVYRYFNSTEALFIAVSDVAAERFLAQLDAALPENIDDVAEFLIEAVAYILEHVPAEPLMMLLLSGGYPTTYSERMLQPPQIARSRTILLSRRVDWAAIGYDDRALDELVEHLIRVMQSLLLVPPNPPRTGKEMRDYLRRWVGPALTQAGGTGRGAEE
jgi:AcrR family transcriptional regulator